VSERNSGRIERVVRVVRLGEEPSLVDEYAYLTNAERTALFLELRARILAEHDETDRGLERVCTVARRP
jgi:hypothetical protein